MILHFEDTSTIDTVANWVTNSGFMDAIAFILCNLETGNYFAMCYSTLKILLPLINKRIALLWIFGYLDDAIFL
jgi:hypothetical protein